ncbi:MAG: hypothetical protein WD772_12195, partial [Pseudohongiellaceae bacterium]
MTETENTPQPPEIQSGSPAHSTALETAVNIFVSPSEAIRSLHTRPTILFPLLVTVISTVIVYAWYYQFVDYAWYVDDMV